MKHFKKVFRLPVFLAVILPFLLIVPNIGLDLTERMSPLANVVNIIMPLSVYALLFSLWKRVGVMTLLMIPMMCFAGFQIVLLYLYGGSIIGVDMFLNVATTNAGEVGELLGNLMDAIGLILLLYLPVLVFAVITICRKRYLTHRFLKRYRLIAVIGVVVSLILTIGCSIFVKNYAVTTHLFPANVFKNLALAFERVERLEKYSENSREFTYNAISQRPDSIDEVYVMVVGETSRGDNWQLAGYNRETNPRLASIDDVVFFPLALTQSNTTHKSVPMIISDLEATNFNNIDYHKSILTAFKEAGYKTYFLSNQKRNRSYTEFFSNEADSIVYIPDYQSGLTYDGELIDLMKNIVSGDTINKKKFVVLHTYGSHFKYNDRYPESYSYFVPDDFDDANLSNRDKLINSFDNSIRYIDSYLADAIETLDSLNCYSALIYAADHGEDIFDDRREKFLHASPIPTSYQLHVPLLVWTSQELNQNEPYKQSLKNNTDKTVSSTVSMFHTICTLAGLQMPSLDENKSLTSDNLNLFEFKYVSDRNECYDLEDLHLPKEDLINLSKFNISK